MEAPARHRVSPAEHDLLAVAQAVVGAAPLASVRALLRKPVPLPASWSPGSMVGLKRILAIGATTSLAKRGGWRTETSLTSPLRRGPLWERYEAPGWRFTRATLDVLLVLRGAPVVAEAPALAVGDELLLYLACDLLARAHHDVTILGPWVAASRLARLAFPEAVAEHEALPELAPPPTVLLEGLQPDLRGQLLRLERLFATLSSPATVAAIGERHEADLQRLWETSVAAGRPDLLTFVADAAPALLATTRPRAVALAHGRVEARQRALRASGATFAVLEGMGREHARWRRAGFLDDDYERSQAMLLRWEHVGADAFAAAGERLRALASLDATLAPA